MPMNAPMKTPQRCQGVSSVVKSETLPATGGHDHGYRSQLKPPTTGDTRGAPYRWLDLFRLMRPGEARQAS
jgi:hypothetical protein